MTIQPQGYQPGIYFNMSNEDYHADSALSHSGMTKLLISWVDYWVTSPLNPERGEYKPTEAMKFGTRSGEFLLENDKFHERYFAYKRSSGSGKGLSMSAAEYDSIAKSIEAIRSTDTGNKYFSNGYGEVSIFWRDEETGIMLRARIDYLRTFGAIDFKRIKSLDDWTIGSAVRNQGLDIQASLYLKGISKAREMLLSMDEQAVRAFADNEKIPLAWLSEFAKERDSIFRFFFQRSAPPYIWEIRKLDSDALREGEDAIRKACVFYKRSLETYGIKCPPYGTAEVKTIDSHFIPRRNYDNQI